MPDDVVRIQISTEPYQNNYGKDHKANAVVDFGEEGHQKYKEGSIVGNPNNG